MAGSPKKRARREAIARGEVIPGESRISTSAARGAPPTAEQSEKILEYMRSGNMPETACAIAGVARPRFRAWLAEAAGQFGGEGVIRPEVAAFVEAFEKAREEGIAARMNRISRAAMHQEIVTTERDADGNVTKSTTRLDRGDWHADAWALERIDPDRFMQRVEMRVQHELQAVLDALEEELPAETYTHVLGVIARRAGRGSGAST